MRLLSSKEVPASVASEERVPLAPIARRTWYSVPAPPVQARCVPAVVAEAVNWNPGVGGPRAPAAPTKKLSFVSALRPALSVTWTRKSYLPAARAVVRSVVAQADRPPNERIELPPAGTGVAGRTGERSIQSEPPAGA